MQDLFRHMVATTTCLLHPHLTEKEINWHFAEQHFTLSEP